MENKTQYGRLRISASWPLQQQPWEDTTNRCRPWGNIGNRYILHLGTTAYTSKSSYYKLSWPKDLLQVLPCTFSNILLAIDCCQSKFMNGMCDLNIFNIYVKKLIILIL